MAEKRKMALLCNAAFVSIAGSELVIMELAEELLTRGWEVVICAWVIADPMKSLAKKAGVRLLEDPLEARPFQYDLVWCQNRLEPIFDYSPSDQDVERTFFSFAHLDRTWSYAQPGVVAEGLLGQLFVVISEKAVNRVVERGLPKPLVTMFRNAAPAVFEMAPPPLKSTPERVLIVSNHAPEELREAASRLRSEGIDVAHFGTGGDVTGHRLLPADLAGADAVVSIGKTVPYALRARRAVYVYDHFGGPGWLTRDNFAAARERNFSGLCYPRKLCGAEIAEEITSGYRCAAEQAACLPAETINVFRLERFVDQLLSDAENARTAREHRAKMEAQAVTLRTERDLAHAAGSYFRRVIRAQLRKVAIKDGTINHAGS